MPGFRTGRPDISRTLGAAVPPLIRILPYPPSLADQGTGSVSGITCTRVGVRSCVKSDASLVKLTTNQLAVEANGMLIEQGVAANRCLRSEEFATAPWVTSSTIAAVPTVTANAAIAPDGTTTADKLDVPAVADTQASVVIQTFTASGVAYTASIFAKAVTPGASFYIYLIDAGTGTPVYSSSLIQPSTTAWARYSVTSGASLTAGSWALGVGVRAIAGGGQSAQAASSFLVWGAQVDAYAYQRAYVPTAGSILGSQDDVVSMANPLSGQSTAFSLGASFTPSYGRTWESRLGEVILWSLGTGGAANYMRAFKSTAHKLVVELRDGANQARSFTSLTSLSGATTRRIVFVHTPGGGSLYIDDVLDGGSWSGLGTGIVTMAASFTLGRDVAGASKMLDGHIYNIRMTAP